MRLDFAVVALSLLCPAAVSAVAVPGFEVAQFQPVEERDESQQGEELWKRKGGGGGGSRGGGSGGSGSSGGRSGSSGSSGSGSGTGGAGSGSGRGSGRGGSSDNFGGSTKGGSGPRPAYGGGQYYGGGAKMPYKAGTTSPLGLAPFFIGGAALAFWPGLWLYGAYTYPYYNPYRFYNESARANQTKAIICGCDPYLPCGCEDNNDTAFLSSIIGTGAYNQLNLSLVNVADYKGNSTILLNGTLPNGTTAAGGEDELDSAANGFRGMAEAAGYWPMVAAACAAVFLV